MILMKLCARYLALLLLPLLFFVASLYFLDAKGPYWVYTNSDSDYIHLLAGLNVARGVNPSSAIIHPGTGLHVVMAGIMKLVHGLRAEDLQTDVLRHPEVYLYLINLVLLAGLTIAVILAGVLLYDTCHELVPALCVQLSSLLALVFALEGSTRVSCEHFHYLCTTVLVCLLLAALNTRGTGRWLVYALLFACVIGLGTAAKVSYAVLLVVPLLVLPGILPRLVALIGAAGFFCLGVMPNSKNVWQIMPQYVLNLIRHGGRHGGESRFFDLARVLANAHEMVRSAPWYFIVLALGVVVAVAALIQAWWSRDPRPDHAVRILLGITAAQIAQSVIVARNPPYYHLTAVLALGGLTLALSVLCDRQRSHGDAQCATGL